MGAKKEWYVGGTVQRAVREVELAELSVGVGPRLGSMVDGSVPSKMLSKMSPSQSNLKKTIQPRFLWHCMATVCLAQIKAV